MSYEPNDLKQHVRINDEGSKFAALLLRTFLYTKSETSSSDAIYYLIKGLEMIHYELSNEYSKEKDYEIGKYYEKKYQCTKLSDAIETLKEIVED